MEGGVGFPQAAITVDGGGGGWFVIVYYGHVPLKKTGIRIQCVIARTFSTRLYGKLRGHVVFSDFF